MDITRLKCRDFGFCLGNDVGWNPHERELRNVSVKINRVEHGHRDRHRMELVVGHVNRDGMLYSGKRKVSARRHQKKKTKRRRKGSKGETNSNDNTSQEEEELSLIHI